MEHEVIETAVTRYYEALERDDLPAWLRLFTEDVQSQSPVGGPIIQGLDGMRLAFKTIRSTLREVSFDRGPVFAGAGAGAVQWTGRGVAMNGRPVTFGGINIFHVNLKGKIRRIEAYWDPNALMRQIHGTADGEEG